MRTVVTTLILFALTGFCTAQVAPNFDVVDSDGIAHNLYEDYLDKGTTVVIKFFFVNCPPCNSIAPSVQELYEKWGEGQFDVQFIELTTSGSDDSAAVAGYKDKHSLTFPSIAADGGASAARSPYTSGQFGTFFGTPTFAVIAADKSVVYNTGGLGNSGKIENLDQAIKDAGAIGDPANNALPAEFTITSQNVFGEEDEIEITLGDENDLSISYPISSNSFSINNLQDEYPGINNPVLRFSKSGQASQKVSPLDMLLMRKHILNIIPITDESMKIAADTNGDGNITPLDMLVMRKLILNIITEFPAGSYQMVPNELPITLKAGELQQLEVKSVKIGDLNGF